MVIHRHFNGDTIEDIRNDIKRTEDIQQTAFSLAEFIEKEGDEVWADKILEQLGPWLMLQLCDMANIFEVMRKLVDPFLSSIRHDSIMITKCFIASTNGEYLAGLGLHWRYSSSSSSSLPLRQRGF